MKIAGSVQKLIHTALEATSGLEPIAFCGMYEIGLNYVFQLCMPVLASELPRTITPVFADLSSGLKTEDAEKEIARALRSAFPSTRPEHTFDSITEVIGEITKRRKIVLVLYLGQEGDTDPCVFQFLSRLRIVLGWKFSYVLFISTRSIFQASQTRLLDNIIWQTAVPVLPRSREDSMVVIQNYESRWKRKIPTIQKDVIATLSGGNPGLIKALFLQAAGNKDWRTPDILDERLFYRLHGLAADLPESYVQVLLRPDGAAVTQRHAVAMLTRYGYLYKDDSKYRVFTPLLTEYLHQYTDQAPHVVVSQSGVDESILLLSKTQRKVYRYIKERPGKLIARDELAHVLWGEHWADRYSEWAIDQLLSVLREKITLMNDEGKIVTKRGEGIIYVPKNL